MLYEITPMCRTALTFKILPATDLGDRTTFSSTAPTLAAVTVYPSATVGTTSPVLNSFASAYGTSTRPTPARAAVVQVVFQRAHQRRQRSFCESRASRQPIISKSIALEFTIVRMASVPDRLDRYCKENRTIGMMTST